jgi:hypothetical protein
MGVTETGRTGRAPAWWGPRVLPPEPLPLIEMVMPMTVTGLLLVGGGSSIQHPASSIRDGAGGGPSPESLVEGNET